MKKFFTFCLLLVSARAFCQVGGVAINPNGTLPDPSAALDVSFTDKGELLPRLNTSQRNAIINPATGLFIYNTDCNVVNYNAGTPANPNWVTVNSSNALIAAVSIFANPSGAICAGTGVSFTAIPGNGIDTVNYQWQLNGLNVGGNSANYSNSNLNNGDVLTCMLSSNQSCVSGSPATSNPIVINVTSIPTMPGNITGSTVLCPDSAGNIYSVIPVAGAASYNWTVPANAVITQGAGTNTITVSFGLSSGNISVDAANACGAGSSVSLAVTVNAPVPSSPSAIAGNAAVDTGSSGNVYSISPVNNATTYTWSVPAGATITAGQGTTSITLTFGTDSGNISVKAANSCGTSAASSLPVSVESCNGASGSQTFYYTGGQQIFTVPLCAGSVTITAYGAQGANGGGLGGSAQGTIAVAPGTLLYVSVGGQNGFNGGGSGGSGANGGDMTDVRMGGAGFANAIIVAGGGGGSFPPNGTGGAGGGGGACGNGAPGAAGGAYVYDNTGYSGPGANGTCTNGGGGGNGYGGFGGGGGGGGLTSGGSGGSSGSYGNYGQNGSFGQGGNYGANDISVCEPYAGGGGGGGYYGGGGGANAQCQAGGGGGGSSYASASMTNLSFTGGIQSGTGQVVITW